MAFDQQKYIDDYVRENYDRFTLKLPKGSKQKLKELAESYDFTDDKGRLSITRLIIDALEEKYGIDLSRPD